MKGLLKKKSYGAGLIAVFTISALLGPAAVYAQVEPAKPRSECIACHTDLDRIIRLSSEIEQIRPESDKTAEGSGEG